MAGRCSSIGLVELQVSMGLGSPCFSGLARTCPLQVMWRKWMVSIRPQSRRWAGQNRWYGPVPRSAVVPPPKFLPAESTWQLARGEGEAGRGVPTGIFLLLVGLDRARLGQVNADALALGKRIEVGGELGQFHARLQVLAQVGLEEGRFGAVILGAVHQVHLGGAYFLGLVVPVRIILGDVLAAVLEATGKGFAILERRVPQLLAVAETELIGRELVIGIPLCAVFLEARQCVQTVGVVVELDGRGFLLEIIPECLRSSAGLATAGVEMAPASPSTANSIMIFHRSPPAVCVRVRARCCQARSGFLNSRFGVIALALVVAPGDLDLVTGLGALELDAHERVARTPRRRDPPPPLPCHSA